MNRIITAAVGKQNSRLVITLILTAIMLLPVVACRHSPAAVTTTTAPSPTVSRPAATAVQPAATGRADEATTSPQPAVASTTTSSTAGEELTFTLAAQSGGTFNAVALDDNIAYLGVGPRLVTVDISDSAAPRFLTQSEVLPDLVEAVAVQRGVAYVGDGRGSLHLYNVTDPARPVRISTLDSVAGSSQVSWVDIILAGNIVYAINRYDDVGSGGLIDGNLSLAVLDVSDPLQPEVVGRRDLPPSAAVAVSGDTLAIVNEGKLQLVDATRLDQTLGEIVVEFKLSSNQWRYFVTVVGHLAYIGVSDQPLQVFDISNPALPKALSAGQINLPLSLTESAVNDEALFLVDRLPSEDGYGKCPSLLRVVDISDAASPRYAAEFDPQSCINDIAVAGDTLAAAGGDSGLQIFDAGDPANLALSSLLIPPPGFTSVDKIILNQDVAYITSSDVPHGERTRLYVLDRTQPDAPTVVGDELDLDLPQGDGDAGLYVQGDRLYIMTAINPMLMLDISEAARPRLMSHEFQDILHTWPVPAPVDNLLYTVVNPDRNSVGVIDLSDPTNPTLLNTFLTWPEGICDLSLSDRYLIVAPCAGVTKWLYDLSDPVMPAEVGQFEPWTNSMPLAYAVVGDTLFYLDRNTLYAQDISDPGQLDIESNHLALELPFEAADMVLAADTLYINGRSDVAGIWAMDVSDRMRPSLAGHVELPDYGDSQCCPCYACGMSVDGDLLYVAHNHAGLFVFQMIAGTPSEVAAIQPTFQATRQADNTPTALAESPAPTPRPTGTIALTATFTPGPEPTQDTAAAPTTPLTGGAVAVAFIEDGEIKLWHEATGQTEVIFNEGGVGEVMISDDGRVIAFTRSWVDEDQCNQLALWAIDSNGENQRELVSPAELRRQFGLGDTWEQPGCAFTFLDFFQLEWLPQTHRLLYSLYPGDSHVLPAGVYLVDADTRAMTVLASAENRVRFVPSPDGRQIALLSTTALSFINADGSDWRQDVMTYPETGVPIPNLPIGVWTQDARHFLLVGPTESGDPFVSNYTIWRVPVDGSAAQPLATITDGSHGSVVFSPDGSRVAFRSQVSVDFENWSITPLAENVGPLAVTRPASDKPYWSPAGDAFIFPGSAPGTLFQLCPDATQATEVCGDPIRLGERVAGIHWIDGDRFVFLTSDPNTFEPRALSLGKLDGTTVPIARWPPEEPVSSGSFAVFSGACIDDSEFVLDVNVPDGTHFAPGASFTKTWRIRNSGSCTWDSSYHLDFVSGERMNGPEHMPIGETVPPGGEVDVSIDLIAPQADGTYRGEWQLSAADGTPFGAKPYLEIVIP